MHVATALSSSYSVLSTQYEYTFDLGSSCGPEAADPSCRCSAAANWPAETRRGSFRTPAPEGTPFNFTFAFSSCAATGSSAPVFDAVLDSEPLLFVHMGDLFYGYVQRVLTTPAAKTSSPTVRLPAFLP